VVVLHSVNDLLKAKDELTAERNAKLQEVAGLRDKLAASQESEQKLEKERDEAQNKLHEVDLSHTADVYSKSTSSSAIAEGPRDALSQLKSCQLLHNWNFAEISGTIKLE